MTRVAAASTVLALLAACSSPPAPVPVEGPGGAAADTQVATAVEVDAGPSIDDLRLAAFTKVIQETAAIRHECWARGAADNYKLSGKVVLAFVLNAEGVPRDVTVDADSTGDAVLTACLVARYKGHPWPAVFEAGTTVKAPFQFDAPSGQYTVSAEHVEEIEVDAGKMLVSHVMHPGNTGNPGFALSFYELYAGYELRAHRHASSAEVAVVLRGRGTVSDLGGKKKSVSVSSLKVGDGHEIFYFPPGKEHSISVQGDGLWVAVFHAGAGPEKRYLPTVTSTDDDMHFLDARERRGRTRDKLRHVSTRKLPKLPIAGGKGWVQIGFEKAPGAGDGKIAAGMIQLDKGVAVPKHTHPGSTEVLFIYRGEGTLTVAGRDYPVRAPMAVQVPPGVEHAFVATAEVEALQFYTPSGPEQRFKAKK